MPYAVEKSGKGYVAVVHPGTKRRKVLGHHATAEEAKKQIQAVIINTHMKGKK